MKIKTKYLGEVEINENLIIDFEAGIPSFLDEKKFILLPFNETTPFYILQSVKTPDLGFVVINPFQFFPDYEVKLTDATIETLQIEKETDVAIFLILTVAEPFTLTTANLQGPVIINSANQKGKQIALSNPEYGTKHFLIPQETSEEEV